MVLALFGILLLINIIGFMNRRRAWSKIFLVSQVLVVGGMVVMFNVYTSQKGIQGIEAKKNAGKEMPAKVDDFKDLAKDKKANVDTIDAEKENQSSQKVKGF